MLSSSDGAPSRSEFGARGLAMTYAGQGVIFDADSHMMELPDLVCLSGIRGDPKVCLWRSDETCWYLAVWEFSGQLSAR